MPNNIYAIILIIKWTFIKQMTITVLAFPLLEFIHLIVNTGFIGKIILCCILLQMIGPNNKN